MADVTVCVDDVSSFSESIGRKSKLAELSGIVDANVVVYGEGSANGTDEATSAVIVKGSSSAVNDADEHGFIVSRSGYVHSFDIIAAATCELFLAFVKVRRTSAVSSQVRLSNSLMLCGLFIESLDIYVVL